MKNKPLVSIFMPTFNRKDLLEKSLESAINQTYTNLEILISDNHSTDGTEELCKEYLKKDNRIKYFRHSENIGMTDNHNFIIEKITGDYFVGLCDDDWLDLDYVEKCVKFAEEHEDYTLITPSTLLYDENYRLLKLCSGEKIDYKNAKGRFKKYLELMKFDHYLASGLFKTCIAKEIIEKDGTLYKNRYAEDLVLLIKYLVAGKMKILSSTHYNKLNNGYSMSVQGLSEIWNIPEGKSYNELLIETLSTCIKKDLFFKKYLTQAEINEFPQIIEKVLKKSNNSTNNGQIYCTALKCILFHPLGIFKKETYVKVIRTLKILLITHT